MTPLLACPRRAAPRLGGGHHHARRPLLHQVSGKKLLHPGMLQGWGRTSPSSGLCTCSSCSNRPSQMQKKFTSELRGGVGEPGHPLPRVIPLGNIPGAQRGIPAELPEVSGRSWGWLGGSLGQQQRGSGRLQPEAPLPVHPAGLFPISLSPLPCLQCRDWGRGEAILASRQAESCGLCLASRGAPGAAGRGCSRRDL